jgi:hypothetical protein
MKHTEDETVSTNDVWGGQDSADRTRCAEDKTVPTNEACPKKQRREDNLAERIKKLANLEKRKRQTGKILPNQALLVSQTHFPGFRCCAHASCISAVGIQ